MEPDSAAPITLERPLIFFDLETTGIKVQEDRIVELSAIKLHPDGTQERLHHLINPGKHIPEEASDIHGICDEDVAGKPLFCDVADEVCIFFTGCDVAGFNVRRFDVPMLMEEFHRCKRYPILLTETKVVDVLSVFHKKEPRNLSAALRFYCNEELDAAHSAQGDVEATLKVFRSQIERYDDLDPTVHALHAFSCDGDHAVDLSGKFARNGEGRIVFNFGKHKNRVVDFDDAEIQGYISWMSKPGNCSAETLMALRRAKAQHHCHKLCMEWLQNKELLASAEHLTALKKALATEGDAYPFSVSRKGKQLVVVFHHSDEPALLLCSGDEKQTALLIVEHSLRKVKPGIKQMAEVME